MSEIFLGFCVIILIFVTLFIIKSKSDDRQRDIFQKDYFQINKKIQFKNCKDDYSKSKARIKCSPKKLSFEYKFEELKFPNLNSNKFKNLISPSPVNFHKNYRNTQSSIQNDTREFFIKLEEKVLAKSSDVKDNDVSKLTYSNEENINNKTSYFKKKLNHENKNPKNEEITDFKDFLKECCHVKFKKSDYSNYEIDNDGSLDSTINLDKRNSVVKY